MWQKWNIYKMYIRSQEKRLADPFSTIVNIPKGLIKRLLEWTFVLKKARLGYIVKLKKKWWEHKRRPSLSAVFVRPFYFPTSLWQKTMLFAISYTTYYSPNPFHTRWGKGHVPIFCEGNTYFLYISTTSISYYILSKVPHDHP